LDSTTWVFTLKALQNFATPEMTFRNYTDYPKDNESNSRPDILIIQ